MDLSQDMKDVGFVFKNLSEEEINNHPNCEFINIGWERKWISKEEVKKLYPDNQDDSRP